MSNFKNGIIFDLDNTLYREPPELHEGFMDGFWAVAERYDLFPTRAASIVCAIEGYKTCGSSARHLANLHGIPEAEIIAAMISHAPMHAIAPCTITQEEIDAFAHVPMSILTNGMRSWATAVLSHIGLDHVFTPERMITFDDTDGQLKSQSERPFRMAAQIIESAPETIVFVDDVVANLRIAKELGMTTVLVTHDREIDNAPVYVDFRVPQAHQTFDLIRNDYIKLAPDIDARRKTPYETV